MNPSFDVGPVRVQGAMQSSKARVFWMDGFLYVASAANNVRRLQTAEPTRDRNRWVADVGDGTFVTFTTNGCSSCGWARMSWTKGSVDELVAVAEKREAKAVTA